jgi:hypothetical protein
LAGNPLQSHARPRSALASTAARPTGPSPNCWSAGWSGAQSIRSISPTIVATCRGYIDRAILPTLGKLELGRLDAATLDAFYAHLRKRGGKGGRPMAASSVHQVHAILSGALNRAVVWGWIAHNPARLASPPSIERTDLQPRRSRTPPGCCRRVG